MLALALLASPARAATVSVAIGPVVSHTSPRYVSFAVDLAQVTGSTFWSQAPHAVGNAPVARYVFGRRRLRLLAAALAPAYLRISGTAANATYYAMSGSTATPSGYKMVLTRAEWDGIGSFARALGLDIVLGVNAGVGPRSAAGVWQADNATQLLTYTAAKRYPLAAVEFGNEPNLFAISGLPLSYDATAYARELRTFDALRERLIPTAELIGPGGFYNNAGSETPYGGALGPLSAQIMPAAPGIYDALAFHQYPATSSRCPGVGHPVPTDPLAPSYLDGVLRAYDGVLRLGRRYDPGAPIWDTEAGSASCGGQQGYSNRFEATFWYLNALGLLAQHGLSVLVRQTLSGSDYGLIDDATLQPNPDYWAALLWHRLMGTSILAPRLTGAAPRLRVYGACTRAGRGTTLLALNLDVRHPLTLRLPAGTAPARVYLVTAPGLLSRGVRLGGRPLSTSSAGAVPGLVPATNATRSLTLPAAAYAFVVVPGAGPAACR